MVAITLHYYYWRVCSFVLDNKKTGLIRVPQRFNAGFKIESVLSSVGARLLGQGVPNYLMKSGWTPGYGEDGGIFDIMEPPGSLPGYKLVNTFTDAGKDIDGNNVGKGNDGGGFFSLSGEVGRVSSGDRMTLAPMIKGTHLNHTLKI